MLHDLNLGDGNNLGTTEGKIAMDSSVRKTRQGHYVISTTDFFFPLVDSPYLQGRIGAANVLSDLFAQGVEHCDFMLMLLAACRDMPEEDRNICTKEMVKGFRDACLEAETPITGGQTVLNPWPIIGGVATSVVADGEFVSSDGAQAGDVLVLTKPLGTQVAVNVHQWKHKQNHFWKQCCGEADEGSSSSSRRSSFLTIPQAEQMMHSAVCSMARLNKNASRCMLKHHAHAATDVTGFGILGHAQNLIENQLLSSELHIEIHTLPCIANTLSINDHVFNFRLRVGYSAETSGGLLISMSEENAQQFCSEIQQLDGEKAWIIGRVSTTTDPTKKGKAIIASDVTTIEV